MKLIAVSRVKNEIDIIEAFVRHNARHFDKLIVLDDGSSDGTYEALLSFQASGLPLVVLREPCVGYEQSRFMTRLLRMAVDQFGADWVAPLDADEFVEPPKGTTLADILASSPPTLLTMAWNNFIWRPEDDENPEPNPVLRLRMRLPPQPRMTLGKVLAPAALLADGKIELWQGNHGISRDGRELPSQLLESVNLCHFPIRSVAQYAGKIGVGYLQYSAMAHWDRAMGVHYLQPFQMLCRGLDALAQTMEANSYRYSMEDTEPVSGEVVNAPLCYAGDGLTLTGRRQDPLLNVLRCAEAIAVQCAKYAEGNADLHSTLAIATPELADASPHQRIAALQEGVRTARTARDSALRSRLALSLEFEQLQKNYTASRLVEQVRASAEQARLTAVSEADGAVARAVFELDTQRMRAQMLAEKLEAMRKVAQNRDHQLAAIYNSTSWALLRPIRAPLRILRGEISYQTATRLFARTIFRALPGSQPFRNRLRQSGVGLFKPGPQQQPLDETIVAIDVVSTESELAGDLALLPELCATPPPALDVAVSIIIPTFNAGAEFFWLIKKLQAQRGLRAVEIVVVDSGSTDGTVELAQSTGCMLVQIDNSEFSHSHSRNLGADKATGDVLLFTVQDAFPIGDHWLQALAIGLLYPSRAENRVSAISCAEFPRTDTELLYNSMIDTHYKFLGCHQSDRVGRLIDLDNISLRQQGQLSDIACMISRSLLLKYRYHGRYAEDLILGIQLIRDGHALGMISSAKIIHSHNRPQSYYVRRVFVDIIFLTDAFPDFGIPHGCSIFGAMDCAYALSRKLRDWRAPQMRPTSEAFAALLNELRDFHLPKVATDLTGDGFGFKPLSAWLERYGKAMAREGQTLNGSDIADAAQLRTMLVDRIANLAEFAEAVYPVIDAHAAEQIQNGVQKALSMAVGAQLAFIYLNASRLPSDRNNAVLELKAILLEGI
jgi:glycosyltransferase involved in cell wall biosynthesis